MSVYTFTYPAVLANFQLSYVQRVDKPAQFPHMHDYYELMIVHRGAGEHQINNTSYSLRRGHFCLICPNDVHRVVPVSEDFSFFYIIVPNQIMSALFDYLGPSFILGGISDPEKSVILLSENEILTLEREADQIIFLKKIRDANMELSFRIFIMNIMTRYFATAISNSRADIPDWLQSLILEMLKKENFSEGLSAMYRISQRSPEYVTRMFGKHLNKSPSALINELRLDYALTMLINTGISIIEISQEVGFNSLSHFYHLFKETYGISPKKFRRQHLNCNADVK